MGHEEFFVVIRRGDPSQPEQGVDMVVIDDQHVLRSVATLLAKRFGVAVRERERTRPVVVGLPKPETQP